MEYTIVERDMDYLLNHVTNYSYALLYMMSELRFCKTSDLRMEDADWEECLEIRLFSDRAEIHAFEKDDEICVIETCDEGAEAGTVVPYLLEKRFHHIGKELLVKEYSDYDSDGQYYIRHTRLCGVVS